MSVPAWPLFDIKGIVRRAIYDEVLYALGITSWAGLPVVHSEQTFADAVANRVLESLRSQQMAASEVMS